MFLTSNVCSSTVASYDNMIKHDQFWTGFVTGARLLKAMNTVNKWEGLDYCWSRKNLACLSKQKNILLLLKTT